MIALKPLPLVFAAASSISRGLSRKTHTPKVLRKDAEMWDFKLPLFCVTVTSYVSDKALGSPALQRLYSTFPGGRPGVGLLLLRVAVGVSAAATGIFYFVSSSSSFAAKWPLGLLLLLSGAASAAGFLT